MSIVDYYGRKHADDYTGPMQLNGYGYELPWFAYVKGKMLRKRNGVGRAFKTREGAAKAVAEAHCVLCELGFPLLRGVHLPTQRLGMIPNTRCSKKP